MDSSSEGGHASFWRRTPDKIDENGTARPTILKSIATDLPTDTASDLAVSEPAQQGKAAVDAIGAFVGDGSRIIGEACFERSIEIDGQFEGTISSLGRISVGKTGRISGSGMIKAAEVIIEGSVVGDIAASERIRVCASGKVVGNLSAPILAIEFGAAIEGHCSTTRR